MGTIRVAAVALLLCAVARSQSCGSINFSGSSGGLTVSPNSFDGDFTVEWWGKLTQVGYNLAIAQVPQYLYVFVTTGTQLCWSVNGNGGCPYVSIIAGQWYHYAMTRAGSDLSFFFDGARVGQTTFSGVIGTPTTVLRIGGSSWKGAIADFRVVKGTALYT